jgi:ankyrin repeat/BTB/POZ domain-containing protein 1
MSFFTLYFVRLLPSIVRLTCYLFCRYGVAKLREHCLDAMALNFELFAASPEFRQMVKSLPPPSGDDAARTTAPSAPGAVGKDNQGNILDDLREKWLAIEGEELDQRDESAREFDYRLEKLVALATLQESERDTECNFEP